ncbi:hypothetical protein PCASD_08817 [Puccinia coronata f. sp. avenae]|uniref:Myb/SANT-like domain-containing protein n=1 Tax=Puccinia coronata f. sp. avenae TaxID=200324 RepID=A0A2N5URY7_9BASI|nr:hypothetical protein PCASD_08817 [Puccinia coronata f. sp. avenae]
MYVKAVKAGKRGKAGFKPEVHLWVASELSKEFPGVELTVKKVKSKLNQLFKKTHDAFVACKGASGFGWNKAECMVTASEDVWNGFLFLHPNAKRFKNTPFPKYTNYQVIFEGNTATRALRISSATALIEEHEEDTPDQSVQGNPANASKPPCSSAQQPGVQPPRHHQITSGDCFENSVSQLIDAFVTSQEASGELAESSAIHNAIEKFQDSFAQDLSLDKLVAGFGVLEEDAKARTFLAIQDQAHALAWMEKQIEMKMTWKKN